MNVAKNLETIRVLDPDGRHVRLGELWREQTVGLAFIRHFGCLFCRHQVAQLRDAPPELRRRGAELVIIGNGRPEHAIAARSASTSPTSAKRPAIARPLRQLLPHWTRSGESEAPQSGSEK